MGLWGRKVCDNLASKRDSESISSETSYSENHLITQTQKTHEPKGRSCVTFRCECPTSAGFWSPFMSQMSKILRFSFMRPSCNGELSSSILLPEVLPIQKHLFCHHREPLPLKRPDLCFGSFPPCAHCQPPDKWN